VGALRHAARTFSLADDLAAKHPEKLKELEALFMEEAEKYHVLPSRRPLPGADERGDGGRPDLMQGRTSLTLAEGMAGIRRIFINVKNKSVTITAEVDVSQGCGNGTNHRAGGRFGGWSLYVKDGKPAYHYNLLGLEQTTIASPRRCRRARPRSSSTSSTTAAGWERAARARSRRREEVAEGRIERTQPFIFSADETADVGIDLGRRSWRPSAARRSPASPGRSRR